MSEAIYRDGFANWQDVQREFSTDAPEPHRVLFAEYDLSQAYEGSADVLWQNADGTFGYVSGGHCSCFGLEDQWEPETYTADQLAGQVERSNYGFFAQHAELIRASLA